MDDTSINVVEVIPFKSFKQMIRLVNQELNKNRYVEIWDKFIYSEKKGMHRDGITRETVTNN